MKCPHIEPDHLQKECLLAEFQETLEKRVLDGTVWDFENMFMKEMCLDTTASSFSGHHKIETNNWNIQNLFHIKFQCWFILRFLGSSVQL